MSSLKFRTSISNSKVIKGFHGPNAVGSDALPTTPPRINIRQPQGMAARLTGAFAIKIF